MALDGGKTQVRLRVPLNGKSGEDLFCRQRPVKRFWLQRVPVHVRPEGTVRASLAQWISNSLFVRTTQQPVISDRFNRVMAFDEIRHRRRDAGILTDVAALNNPFLRGDRIFLARLFENGNHQLGGGLVIRAVTDDGGEWKFFRSEEHTSEL